MRASLFVAIAAIGGVALAAPAPRRVVVTDPDPELVQALVVSLRPWHIQVVTTPDDTAEFVVTREDGELVVQDRIHATTERRPTRSGVLDPVSAAESALTVKTMMRLPPPPADDASADVSHEPVRELHDGVSVRVQLGGGANAAVSGDGGTSATGQLGVFVRPWVGGWVSDLRFGVRGDLGTSTSVNAAGFKGTWRDAAVIGIASWAHGLGASFEIEPWIGAGISRGVLDGTEMADARRETAIRARIAGGGLLRWHIGAFSVGAGVAIDLTPSSAVYNKTTSGVGNPPIFQSPAASLTATILAAVELGG